MSVQQTLVSPTEMWGFVPFINPPHAAAFFAVMTFIPYGWAFVLWTVLNIVCLGGAALWLSEALVPDVYRKHSLNGWQMIFLSGAFFATVEGVLVGQNHGLSLLLASGVVILTLQNKSWQAGLLAGLMLYKPQFTISFLILWLAWRNWQALAGFCLSAGGWVGITLLVRGLEPYLAYLQFLPVMIQAIALKGMGSYLELTLYGLLVGLFGGSSWQKLVTLNQFVMFLSGIGLGWYAWRQRKVAPEYRLTSLMLALLFPLVVTPHALLHDAIVLIPFFVLWLRWNPTHKLLYIVISVFLATFILPFVTHYLNFPLLALIPIGLVSVFLREMISQQTKSARQTK